MRIAWLCAAAAVLALAACGGGDSEKHFVDEGTALCNRIQDAAYAVDYSRVTVPPQDPEATKRDLRRFADALDQTIAAYRRGLEELRGLKPPSGLAAGYARALEQLDRSLDRLDTASRAARNARRALLRRSLVTSQALRDRARSTLQSFGLTTCRF